MSPGRTRVTNPPPVPMLPSGLRDNRNRGRVIDFLQEKLCEECELAIVSTYFTIHAYHALMDQLDQIGHLRFLFGEPSFISSIDPDKTDAKAFHIEDEGISLSNRLQQRYIAKQCADWLTKKATVRSIKHRQLLHGKLYHIHDGRRDAALLGSSNFTLSGIGASEHPNIELNLVVDNDRDRDDIRAWFDEIWDDESLVEDVKDEVLAYLAQVYVDHDPEFVYFKTLYHLFERFLDSKAEDDLRFQQLAILDTAIWRALYEFQRDGVKGAINKINTHNGCILADSVGLGKTYTALAIIKYFELRNDRVLVLCPKKLRDNWTIYLAQNNTELNPFLRDRFAYTVMSHTDLSRDSGKAGDVDLSTINWGNYDLVVIDESHNFRNDTRGKLDQDGRRISRTRYERLMEDIIQAGVKTKVLLLSATPVNNDLKDLRNQIAIITGKDDAAFAESLTLPSVADSLTAAQRTFKEWALSRKDDHTHKVKELLDRLPASFFTLLDSLTIARSRKHIKRYYASTMAQIGDFPKRNKPRSVYSEIDALREFMSYDDLNDEINNYQLSLFRPSYYVLGQYRNDYARKAGNFSQMDRERFLVGMMKVGFLKRLESSVHSFGITMERTVAKIEALESRLRSFLRHQAMAEEVSADADDLFEDEEIDETEAFEVGKSLKYNLEHLKVEDWLRDLERDRLQLERLRKQAQAVSRERDAKFAELKTLILHRVKNPSANTDGEIIDKVIVFTAFADTAAYLFDGLKEWAREELGVHIAMVSGGAKPCQTTFGKANYSDILINFSPRSKNRDKMKSADHSGEISILIATDCISEGQNLQDCDLLINYDIHWNPVRIIQRFGRIDRIGSLHQTVSLINFWPTPDLNKYINLKNRVEARMALVDIAATAEDNLLAADLEELIKDDLKYRDKQLLRLKDEILDLEDFQETPSLNEFTLDDFRMELANYIEANRKLLADAPLGLYAVVPPGSEESVVQPGVIFCLRQVGQTEGTETFNPLQPYYLVYVRDSGDVRYTFAQPKQILDMMRAVCAGQTEAYKDLCALFDSETKDGRDMTAYSDLLERSVKAIVAQVTKRSASTLFSGRGAKLTNASIRVKSAEDFELITWLIVKEAV